MLRRQGFTLIELLVVIAIIALLLSIIMPALGKAKIYAEEIVCKSSPRQYGIATEMYTNENKGFAPGSFQSLYAAKNLPGESNPFCRWHLPQYNLETHPEFAGPFWPYLEVTEAHLCPTFAKMAPSYGQSHLASGQCVGGPFIPNFGYSMNSVFGGDEVTGLERGVRLANAKSPSQMFLWSEENMWTLTCDRYTTRGDGQLSSAVLNDTNLRVRIKEATAGDCFGSFHKISKAKLSLQRTTNKYEPGVGYSNVLLVDGSMTWLTPLDKDAYKGVVR
jgi:prepilin-type N-terminal cleavage/methylation domain-containing protein